MRACAIRAGGAQARSQSRLPTAHAVLHKKAGNRSAARVPARPRPWTVTGVMNRSSLFHQNSV
jgi:hypothetical protein